MQFELFWDLRGGPPPPALFWHLEDYKTFMDQISKHYCKGGYRHFSGGGVSRLPNNRRREATF